MYEFIVNVIDMNGKEFAALAACILVILMILSSAISEIMSFIFRRRRYVYFKKQTQSLNGRTDEQIYERNTRT